MTDLLQSVINLNYPVMSVAVDGGWVEVDEVSDLNLELTNKRLMMIQRSLP